MTKTPSHRRVYAVHHAGTGATRLVRAVNVATAVRHVVRTDYTAEVASQDDLIDLLSAGARVEDAGADDLGEPPVKVLRFAAAAAEPPPERDPRVPDMFGDAPAADHVVDAAEMVDPLAAGGFAPCGRALGDCGKATQACGRDGCGVELATIAAGLPAEFLSYIDGQEEPAAVPPGELVGCPSAAPTAVEPAGASSAVDDDGGRELTAAEQAAHEAQGAARFERHHGGELRRQAEAAAARAGGKIVAKYRDPATGQTWSGRGLKPKWLLAAIEAGRTQDEFLISNEGAQA